MVLGGVLADGTGVEPHVGNLALELDRLHVDLPGAVGDLREALLQEGRPLPETDDPLFHRQVPFR